MNIACFADQGLEPTRDHVAVGCAATQTAQRSVPLVTGDQIKLYFDYCPAQRPDFSRKRAMRLLMNLALLQAGYPLAIIPPPKRWLRALKGYGLAKNIWNCAA